MDKGERVSGDPESWEGGYLVRGKWICVNVGRWFMGDCRERRRERWDKTVHDKEGGHELFGAPGSR